MSTVILFIQTQLREMRSCIIFVITLFVTYGVFGVEIDGVKTVSVSVMEGESATLHTNVTLKLSDVIRTRWFQNESRIADIDLISTKICTDVQCNAGNERFRDRLQLNHQTGSLTITNTRTTDSGLYELKISRRDGVNEKMFYVNVITSDLHSADQDLDVSSGESSGESSGVSLGAVAGIIIGVLLVVGVILYLRRTSVRNAAVVHVIYQRTRRSRE